MIESSLSKLEQLVSDLVQQKQELLDANSQLTAINKADMAFLYYYFDSCSRFISKRQRHFLGSSSEC